MTTFGIKDIYIAMATKLLKENPEYWAKKDRSSSVKYGYIYTKRGDRVVEVMSYRRFMKVVRRYFTFARKRVIAGMSVNLGSNLGRVQARCITRNFKKKVINWEATMARPKELDVATGKMKRKMVYFVNDTYSRIKWEQLGKIANESVYKFYPSGGNRPGKGFKREFSTALHQDPLLERKFKQFKNGLQLG